MSMLSRLKYKISAGGSFHIGPRITVYWGNSAMHWTVQFWTKKYGYICKRFRSKGVKPYFYVSPNATPWASTYYRGPDKDERVRAVIRRECFGHNFNPHGFYQDTGGTIPIQDILFAINDYTGGHKYFYKWILKAMKEFNRRES